MRIKRTSKRGMPTTSYLTCHFITTSPTHSNTHSTSKQIKYAKVQEKGSYRTSCRKFYSNLFHKKATTTPTHLQYKEYRNKEAPPELNNNKKPNSNKTQDLYIIKGTTHQENKKRKTVENIQLGQEQKIDTTLQHALARKGTNRHVISPILPHRYEYD